MMFKNPCKKKLKANPAKHLDDWVSNGKPSPPPQRVKEMTVEEFRNRSQSEILVETVTSFGDMIKVERDRFQKIFSIEWSEKVFQRAKKSFNVYRQVKILRGDSGTGSDELIVEIGRPA